MCVCSIRMLHKDFAQSLEHSSFTLTVESICRPQQRFGSFVLASSLSRPAKKNLIQATTKSFYFWYFFFFVSSWLFPYILFFSIISSIVLSLFLALVGHVWYYFDPLAQLGGLYISLITKSLILPFYILDFISKWAGPTKTYWCRILGQQAGEVKL